MHAPYKTSLISLLFIMPSVSFLNELCIRDNVMEALNRFDDLLLSGGIRHGNIESEATLYLAAGHNCLDN